MIVDLELPDAPVGTPNERLIRLNYRKLSALGWSADRFLRLCSALQETKYEVGARIGLHRRDVDRKLEIGSFNATESILLTFIERAVRHASGMRVDGELFINTKQP